MNDLQRLRRRMLEIACTSGEGHLPSCFSVLEIIWTLYDRVLGVTPATWRDPHANRFVLSKGHAALALYSVLAEHGFITQAQLSRFCGPGSELAGHPGRMFGVEHPTGSLGHGLSFAAGLAFALRRQGDRGRVYCLIGDQELQEGSTWEAALFASVRELSNLTCIVDDNRSAEDSLSVRSIPYKFQAFGWPLSTCDGNDCTAIERHLTHLTRMRSGILPTMLHARTAKGFGCATLRADPRAWHHRAPTRVELEQLIGEMQS